MLLVAVGCLATACGHASATTPAPHQLSASTKDIDTAAAADQAAVSGRFHERLRLINPDGTETPAEDRFGRFDHARHLLELRVVTGATSAGGAQQGSEQNPDVTVVYQRDGVLMRNRAFQQRVHKQWVRFTPDQLKHATGVQFPDLQSAEAPVLEVAKYVRGPVTVSLSYDGSKKLRAQLPVADAAALIGASAARTIASASPSPSGSVPAVFTVDSKGRLVGAQVELTKVVMAAASVLGEKFPRGSRVMYDVAFTDFGAPQPIAVPPAGDVAPAPLK